MSGIGMEPDLGSTSPNSDRLQAILTQNKVSYPQLSPPLELHAKPFYAQPNVFGGRGGAVIGCRDELHYCINHGA